MTHSKHGVAVTGKDNLALLGHLKEATHRSRRLRKHGTVGGATAAAHGATAAMHEHQVDVVRIGPARNALLRRMQRQRGGGGTGVLRGVRVTQHHLKLAACLDKAALDRRQLDHLVEHVNAALKVFQLLKERNHIERRHVLGHAQEARLASS